MIVAESWIKRKYVGGRRPSRAHYHGIHLLVEIMDQFASTMRYSIRSDQILMDLLSTKSPPEC